MILEFKDLMSRNLKGYKFSTSYQGMTMTSRLGLIHEYFIVLEDNGDTCVVADLYKRDKTQTWSKKTTASKIAYSPLLTWNKETKQNENSIEQL